MKEIKAFIHRNRIGDIVHALKAAHFRDISVIDVKGLLKALDLQEQEYSTEIGARVITEVKLELVCEDALVDKAVAIIRENGRTGQKNAGWVYVSDIANAYKIGDPEA
jgi:nitrogen regulatory protein P-II 1